MATPWARLAAWVRRLRGRPQTINPGVIPSGLTVFGPRLTARAGPAAPGATDAERIEWLERCVENLDHDINGLYATIDDKAEELAQAGEQRAEELRREMDRREEQRRETLRPSMRRQVGGAICVFVGLVLATIGGAM